MWLCDLGWVIGENMMDREGKTFPLGTPELRQQQKRAFVEKSEMYSIPTLSNSAVGLLRARGRAKPYISSLPTNSIHHSSARAWKNKFELSQLSFGWKQQTGGASPHLTRTNNLTSEFAFSRCPWPGLACGTSWSNSDCGAQWRCPTPACDRAILKLPSSNADTPIVRPILPSAIPRQINDWSLPQVNWSIIYLDHLISPIWGSPEQIEG